MPLNDFLLVQLLFWFMILTVNRTVVIIANIEHVIIFSFHLWLWGNLKVNDFQIIWEYSGWLSRCASKLGLSWLVHSLHIFYLVSPSGFSCLKVSYIQGDPKVRASFVFLYISEKKHSTQIQNTSFRMSVSKVLFRHDPEPLSRLLSPTFTAFRHDPRFGPRPRSDYA